MICVLVNAQTVEKITREWHHNIKDYVYTCVVMLTTHRPTFTPSPTAPPAPNPFGRTITIDYFLRDLKAIKCQTNDRSEKSLYIYIPRESGTGPTKKW